MVYKSNNRSLKRFPTSMVSRQVLQEQPARDTNSADPAAEIAVSFADQSLTTYRLYKLFEPKTVYQFAVSRDTRTGEGRIIGGSGLPVHFQPVGQAQIWKGGTYGVLWKCFPSNNQRERQNWQVATFWPAVENDMGVRKIFTKPREPTFEEGYTEFLSNRVVPE